MTKRMTIEPAVGRSLAVWPVYAVEALGSVGGNLLLVGIFFFTHQQFHWTLRQNLTLAAGQGVFGIVGALSTARLSARLSRATFLLIVQAAMLAIGLIGYAFPSPDVITPLLLIYVMFSTSGWPALESLASEGVSGPKLARRLAMYNLVWSGANAVTLAVSGVVIERWPAGVFVLVAVAHAVAVVTVWLGDFGPKANAEHRTPNPEHRSEAPEPELLHQRSVALWLSRIALPSTYVVAYSLSAMMPTLAVLAPLSVRQRTLVGSAWFVSRCLAFGVLGVATFWHTRPRLMLWALAAMGIAFLATCVRPGDLLPIGHSMSIDLPTMLAGQLALGAAMAVIYSASLYFGMVLSDGSTSHGGYHEALIGVGSTVGPAVAAGADVCFPGRPGFSIAAVAGLVAISFVLAATRAAKSTLE